MYSIKYVYNVVIIICILFVVELPVVNVREWVRDKTNLYKHYHLVKAEPLGWGVPTVHRLWFG